MDQAGQAGVAGPIQPSRAPVAALPAWAVALSFVVAAAALALAGRSIADPLWLDEIYSGAAAQAASFPALLHNWIANDVHPPLYLSSLWVWCRVAGTSELALRLPSLVAFAGTLALLPIAGRRVLGDAGAVIALILFASAATPIHYAHEARSYAILMLASSAASLAYVEHRLRPSRRSLWRLSTVALPLAETHYFGLMLAGLLFAVVLVVDWAAARNRAQLLVAGTVLALPVSLLLAWHLPSLAAKTGGHFWITPLGFGPSLAIGAGTIWNGAPGLLLSGLVPPLISLRAGRTATAEARIAAELLAVVIGLLLLVATLSCWSPLAVPRYFSAFIPPAIIAAALLLASSGTIGLQVAAAAAILALGNAVASERMIGHDNLVWQQQAERVEAAGVDHLVFFLDDPVAPVLGRTDVAAMGAFYARRADHPLVVDAWGGGRLGRDMALPTGRFAALKITGAMPGFPTDAAWPLDHVQGRTTHCSDGDPVLPRLCIVEPATTVP